MQAGGSLARTGLPQPVTTTAYNAANRLTQWGTATPTYDANGNTLSDGTNTYVWNARNQLASMNTSGETFQYDSFGRRVSKKIVSTTTNYLYDGVNPAQELSGTTVTANLLTGGIDEYFLRTDSTGARNFLADGVGSTLALTDSTGTIQTQYSFDPFGNTTSSGASSTSSYQYTGRENDGTGLYFYRARYYNPTLQRFISEDPIGFAGGDANLYAYVGNSPTNFFDPIGEFGWPLHVRITNNALQAAGLSPDPGMAQQVAAVDRREGSQGTDANDTNTHAMSGMTTGRKPHNQTCGEASQGTQDQLVQDVNSGDLTKALHTIQDSYSPSHEHFQFWDGGYTWLHIPGLGHMYGDFKPPDSAVNAATDASTRFLKDMMERPNGPIDPSRYLSPNPCR